MMKQYSVFYGKTPIEYTGYFKSVAAVRNYLKSRYKDGGAGLTFRAVGEQTTYIVKNK